MKRLFGLILAAAALPAAAQDRPVVTVNGQPIAQSAVIQRMWRQHGGATVDLMVQEELIRQAAAREKVKADEKEVEARFKRVRDRFADEAAFRASLQQAGGSPEGLRAQIEEQVLREGLVSKAKKIEVTKKDVQDYFDQNKDKLATPESVHLRHLLVANEQQARDLLVAVNAGADFAKLASEISLDAASKEKGGDLGFISRGILVPEIENAAFALRAGGISPVIRTNLGFHILKVDERREAKPAVFKEIKDDLQRALTAQRIQQAWPEYLKELREKAEIRAPAGAGGPAAP